MKRNVSPPVILAFPTAERNRSTQLLTRRESQLERLHRLRCVSPEVDDEPAGERLTKMRARLLRMIIENERVRNDGPRAS